MGEPWTRHAPSLLQEVQQNTLKVSDTMCDLDVTIRGTEDARDDILEKVKQNIYLWKKTVLVEKSVFDVLNLLSFKGQTVVAECWAPKEDLDNVQRALSEAEMSSGAQVRPLPTMLAPCDSSPTGAVIHGADRHPGPASDLLQDKRIHQDPPGHRGLLWHCQVS